MTRSDLVDALAERFSQLAHRDAELAVRTMLDAMGDALVKGHRIEIRGFGSFTVNHRPARVGRNPRSGERVDIPEKRVPHFKPGKGLREAVDQPDAAAAHTTTQQRQLGLTPCAQGLGRFSDASGSGKRNLETRALRTKSRSPHKTPTPVGRSG